jgi:hypothetical protein
MGEQPPGVSTGRLEETELDIFILMVDGGSPEKISARMGKVADLALGHDACVDVLISSIVVLVFGMKTSEAENAVSPVITNRASFTTLA